MDGESDVGDGYEREPPVLGGVGRRPDRDRGCAITAREEASDEPGTLWNAPLAPSLCVKRRVGRRWWTMKRSDGARRRRPPRSVSLGRWGACGGRPHGRVYGDRVSRVMGGVLRSTREEGARLRVPPRGRGAGDDQWCSPPSSRASPPPPLGESARACAAHAASPPSAPAPGGVGRSRRGRPAGRDPALAPVRAARSGCRRRRTVRHPVPPRFAPPGPGSRPLRAGRRRLLPGSCRPADTAPGPKRVGRPWSGPAAAPPPRSEPARPRPDRESLRPRHRSPNSNRSRASLRAGASQEPPPRQETHPGAPQSARSPGNPRARHLTREIVT